jgi:hypothetical protein
MELEREHSNIEGERNTPGEGRETEAHRERLIEKETHMEKGREREAHTERLRQKETHMHTNI